MDFRGSHTIVFERFLFVLWKSMRFADLGLLDFILVPFYLEGSSYFCYQWCHCWCQFHSVCIQVGWSFGFKYVYLQHSEAGDQVCGHTVAGLDVNSPRFAISPPFFMVHEEDGSSTSSDELLGLFLIKEFLWNAICWCVLYLHHCSTMPTICRKQCTRRIERFVLPYSTLECSAIFHTGVVNDDLLYTVTVWFTLDCSAFMASFGGVYSLAFARDGMLENLDKNDISPDLDINHTDISEVEL